MKNQFDGGFDPPAPTGTVTIRNISTGKRSAEIKVILDTGSDVTLLPRDVIAGTDMDLPTAPSIDLEAFDGTSRRYESVTPQLVFLGKRVEGVYFLVNDPMGILGRDVLNHFAILFDGLALEWDRIDRALGELS